MFRFFSLLAALVIPGIAAAQTPAVHPTTLSSPAGKFVFGQINGLARDQYMLDTQSGRLWQIVCIKTDENDSSKCLMRVLQAIPYDSDVGLTELPPGPSSYGPRRKQEEQQPRSK